MFNVQALSQTLSAMPLDRLQAYLRQHQDDPYTVALGLSIAKRKKEAMMAQQGMAGQQPMPKVVDQEIAQVAPRAMPMPEDVGIGQLPAQNLARMAGGGIVAFDEGGEVPHFDGSDGSVVEARNPLAFLNPGDIMSRIGRIYREGINPAVGQNIDLARAMSAPGSRPATTEEVNAMLGMSGTAAPTGPAGPAAPPAAPTGPRPPVGPTPVAPAAPAATVGIPGLITTQEGIQQAIQTGQKGITPEVPAPIAEGIKALQQKEQTAVNEYLESVRSEQAQRNPALKDFENRLKQRESRLTDRERELGPLAMLQAGLAIMGGTSPYAAANIGAGAQVGIAAYTKGADKLEEARDKMDEAYAKIEEVRRNESRMDAKELREAMFKAKQPAIEAQKTMFNALHEDWKLKRSDALKGVELLVSNQQTLVKEAGANARMAMQVNAPSATERLYTQLGGGDIEKGLRKYGEIMGPEARGLPALLQKYADPVKLQTLKATDPELYNYIRSQLATQMLQPTDRPTGPVRE